MYSYIPPVGQIDLMTGVPLNPKQEDTMRFTSTQNRDLYFNHYIFAHFEEQTFSRPGKGVVRIASDSESLYKCNYMRFKNIPAFGTQWIYAFVTNVEYVNLNTADITYIIDDLVTWFPQCELKECFVDREIPATDNLYEHLVPESFELGDYVCNYLQTLDFSNDLAIVFCVTSDEMGDFYSDIDNPEDGYSHLTNGLLSPLAYRVYDMTMPFAMQSAYLTLYAYQHNGVADNIVSIQYVPKVCTEGINSDEEAEQHTFNVTIPEIHTSDLDGYRPRNKKLFSYPYCFLVVSNNSGQTAEYKYELMKKINEFEAQFFYYASCFGQPAIFLYPETYQGEYDNFDSGLMLTNFPIVPWQNDAFQAYLAQNKASLTTGILCSAVESATGILTSTAQGAIFGGGAGAAMNLITSGIGALTGSAEANMKAMAKIQDAKAIPNTVHGQMQSDGINLAMHRVQFDFKNMTIRQEMARTIDNFFSMYGYAIHKIKIPDIKSRPFWNYVKTNGCVVTGPVPASALANISSIFDRGIRFWQDALSIGNYELDNSPVM